jgi:hypothetical protein
MNILLNRAVALMAGVVMAGGAAVAQAQTPPQARPTTVQRLVECRKVAEDRARLACFDEAAAQVEIAEQKGDIVIVDRDRARQFRRQAFGFSMPSISLFERGESEEEVDTLTLRIESVSRTADGKLVLRLEGGQVWRQIDTNLLSRPARPGGTATIKRALMGSYKLSTGGGAAIRVHREN